jgi:hypothetical protein
MTNERNISYLNKTFTDFKANLINYAQTYFPTVYNDFTDSNPGALFIEMASYVGDVMSFYLDTQVQENFLLYAQEQANLFALSYVLGYRPNVSYAASTKVNIYQLMPSTTVNGVSVPDTSYALLIPANTVVTSNSTGTQFLTMEPLDFSDLTNATVTYVNNQYFLVQQSVPVMSAQIKTTNISFSSPQKFTTTTINDTNILQILNIFDSQGNQWYEVPYLAQSSVFTQIPNPNYSSDQVPYLLSLQRVPYRFVSRFLSNNTLQLEFGAGVSNYSDNTILPTPDNVQLGLVPGISTLEQNYNQASIFYTQEYGVAPSNTTLTIQYLVGGGITSNVPSNDLTLISTSGITFKSRSSSDPLFTTILGSLASTNSDKATGGRGGDTIEEIRNNALYAYSSQLRAVTKNDYLIRTLSLPSEYGSIAKAYPTQDFAYEGNNPTNPLAISLYILAYNSNKQLTQAATSLKNNLVTYLNEYRMATDAINIKDAYYINIGVNFDITVATGYNNNTVLANCILNLQNYFSIDNWAINQPIPLSDVNSVLLQTKGVQSIVKLEIVNLQDSTGATYSPYGYDIQGATKKNTIYPSLDPAVFEVRYPNNDINGRVVSYY